MRQPVGWVEASVVGEPKTHLPKLIGLPVSAAGMGQTLPVEPPPAAALGWTRHQQGVGMSITCSPRVVGHNRPDFHSLESILAGPPFAGKSGEALVLAIYNYFTSKLDGTYHFWPHDERGGHPAMRRANFDAARMLNCYGWAICGQNARFLYDLYRAAGLEARCIGLPGHALCEVKYDGRWHILDVDMWTWFRTPEGHIASAAELAGDAFKLILENTNKSDPCNLPDRSLQSYAEMYSKTPVAAGHVKDIAPHYSTGGHAMDFRLRPGERLIRSQAHASRFHMPQDWTAALRRWTTEWHGHPRERFDPFRSMGNGRWIYQPNLAAGWRDLDDGAWQRQGLTQNDQGLAGPGEVSFRIQSPYIFCGIPNWSKPQVTSSEGAWLYVEAEGGVVAELTDAEGRWVEVGEAMLSPAAGVPEAPGRRYDITPIVDGRYECLIRFRVPAGGRLRGFRFEGYIMTAPMSLPRLTPGDNPMEVRYGDARGLATTPWSQIVDFRSGSTDGQAAAQAQAGKPVPPGKPMPPGPWHQAQNARLEPYVEGWQMISPTQADKPVRAVWRFDAPAGRRFAWFHALAGVREGPVDQPRRRATLEWSPDGQSWRALTSIEISNSYHQWDTSLDAQADIDGGAEAIWIALTSQTPITDLEFHGHLLEQPHQADSLRIVHTWLEDAQVRRFEAPPTATRYVLRCGPNPTAHTIDMSVPSARK